MRANCVKVKTRTSQGGESLVSLMVGLLISAVVALAMLSMFKVASRSGGRAGQDAAADGQLISALLRAGTAAQDAGFGISTPTLGTHLRVISGASLSSSYVLSGTYTVGGSGNAVVWSMNTTGTSQCAGLYFKDTDEGAGGLYYLGPVACATGDVSTWSTLVWNTTALPPQRWADRPGNQSSGSSVTGAYDQTKIAFATASTACKPFGLDGSTSSANLVFTISSTNRSGAPLSEQQCLFNFKS